MANEEMDLDLDLDLDDDAGSQDMDLNEDLDLGEDLGGDLDLGDDDLGGDLDLGGDDDLGGDLDLGGDDEDFGAPDDEPLDTGEMDMDMDLDLDDAPDGEDTEEPPQVDVGGDDDLDMSGLEAELGVDESDIPTDDGSKEAIKEVDSDDDLENELASLNEDLVLDESMEVREMPAPSDEDLGDADGLEDFEPEADDLDLSADLGEENLEEEEDFGGDAMEADLGGMDAAEVEEMEPLSDDLSGELDDDLEEMDLGTVDDSFDTGAGDDLDLEESSFDDEEDFEEPPTLPDDTLVDLSEKEMDLKDSREDLLEEELETPLPDDLSAEDEFGLGEEMPAEEEMEMPEEFGFDESDEAEEDQFAALEEDDADLSDLDEPVEDAFEEPEPLADSDLGGFEEPEETAFGGFEEEPAPEFDTEDFEPEELDSGAFGDLEEPLEEVGGYDESAEFEIDQTAPETERMKVDLGEDSGPTSAPEPATQAAEAPAAEGLVGKNLLYRIPHQLKVEVGQAQLTGEDLTRLNYGSVIQLDRKIGDPVDIVLGGEVVAQGEVVQINEDQLGVRITRIDF